MYMNFGDQTIFKLHSTTDKIKQNYYLLPLYLVWIYKTKTKMVKYIKQEIKSYFFFQKKKMIEWKGFWKNTTAKWLDYIMFWKKKWNLQFFFDAYLQIKLTTVYFFSKLYVKLAVIR